MKTNIRLKKTSQDLGPMKQAGKVHTACFVLIEQMLQEQKHTLKEINIAVEKYIADQ
ncbi:MAG: hypothetical protein U9Q15_04255 [Patescibacteria group bacterium]|nr:hypothetical protein [Patescibacteria group bacterium]